MLEFPHLPGYDLLQPLNRLSLSMPEDVGVVLLLAAMSRRSAVVSLRWLAPEERSLTVSAILQWFNITLPWLKVTCVDASCEDNEEEEECWPDVLMFPQKIFVSRHPHRQSTASSVEVIDCIPLQSDVVVVWSADAMSRLAQSQFVGLLRPETHRKPTYILLTDCSSAITRSDSKPSESVNSVGLSYYLIPHISMSIQPTTAMLPSPSTLSPLFVYSQMSFHERQRKMEDVYVNADIMKYIWTLQRFLIDPSHRVNSEGVPVFPLSPYALNDIQHISRALAVLMHKNFVTAHCVKVVTRLCIINRALTEKVSFNNSHSPTNIEDTLEEILSHMGIYEESTTAEEGVTKRKHVTSFRKHDIKTTYNIDSKESVSESASVSYINDVPLSGGIKSRNNTKKTQQTTQSVDISKLYADIGNENSYLSDSYI